MYTVRPCPEGFSDWSIWVFIDSTEFGVPVTLAFHADLGANGNFNGNENVTKRKV